MMNFDIEPVNLPDGPRVAGSVRETPTRPALQPRRNGSPPDSQGGLISIDHSSTHVGFRALARGIISKSQRMIDHFGIEVRGRDC
jgi:hypothetical protein